MDTLFSKHFQLTENLKKSLRVKEQEENLDVAAGKVEPGDKIWRQGGPGQQFFSALLVALGSRFVGGFTKKAPTVH